uniref:G_PROTEIN_RECEP_F1_2 domain-containing protein n=1 Tax=Macrostomum lignano TaxID=282301 RepID=A0A1I8IYS7_9PLAT
LGITCSSRLTSIIGILPWKISILAGPIAAKRTGLLTQPSMATKARTPAPAVYYRFVEIVNCTEADYRYQSSGPLLALVVLLNLAQMLLTGAGILLNSLSYAVLTRAGAQSELARLLRYLAVPDTLYVLLNLLDNACHTLQVSGGHSREFYLALAYLHPPAWALRVSLVMAHNWLMLLIALSRVIKIYAPLRSRSLPLRRHLKCVTIGLCILALTLGTPRFMEVNLRLAACPDGLHYAEIATTKLTRMYTGLVNFGLQIGGPVLAACVCNWLTVLRVRRSGRELRSQHGQGHRARRCAEQRSGQATRTVLMLTNLYIACQLPQLAWGVIALTNLTPGVYIALTLVSNAVGSLDGSCNFFIYVASNNRFKTCLLTEGRDY